MCFAPDRDLAPTKIDAFLDSLIAVAQELGIEVKNTEPPILYGHNNPAEVERILNGAWSTIGKRCGDQPQLILCLLPTTNVTLYAEIKRVCDTSLGVASQCLLVKNIHAPKKQYCANVCLKINVKLGGLNVFLTSNQLPFLSEVPTVVFGCDLLHPSASDPGKPSVASLVATMDSKASSYASTVRTQFSRNELILDLQDMVRELLVTFYQTTGLKPERILFYRDGISEYQFTDVLRSELPAIVRACQSLDPDYQPTITFVVVQKRHHARFFPVNPADADRSQNTPAGTVVEKDITNPHEFDFYLCSHSGLQGTSKPAHYHVLFDDNGFSADELQDLTYKLCYLYARCTRSVSVVPPVYYAHLVAFRARFHLVKKGSNAASDVPDHESIHFAPVKAPLQKSMYFM